jgi:hypothetical protein
MQNHTQIPVPEPARAFHFQYEVLKGYFKQSESETDDTTFDFVGSRHVRYAFVNVLTSVGQRRVRPHRKKLLPR